VLNAWARLVSYPDIENSVIEACELLLTALDEKNNGKVLCPGLIKTQAPHVRQIKCSFQVLSLLNEHLYYSESVLLCAESSGRVRCILLCALGPQDRVWCIFDYSICELDRDTGI